MKLSKSILQSVAFGLALGSVTVSCEFLEPCEPSSAPSEETLIENCIEQEPPSDPTSTGCGNNNLDPRPAHNCPACGMG